MNLEYFGYMLEINRFHSISSAARALNISQARLSSIVKTVEDQLNYAIFQRTPQGVELTPVGEQFMALAWDINIKHESLMSLKTRSIKEIPSISLALPPSVALRLALPLAQQFQRFKLPGTLDFREDSNASIVKNVLNNDSNIGIAYLSTEDLLTFKRHIEFHALQTEYLMQDKLYLLAGKDHPFAARESVDAQELYNSHLLPANTSSTSLLLNVIHSESRYSSTRVNVDAMYQLIHEDGMIGFVPGFLNHPDSIFDPSHFRFVPLENTRFENQLHLVLFTFKDRTLRHQEKILLQCLREYFQKIEADEHSGVPAGGGSL